MEVPVSGSRAVGLNCACWPDFVSSGDSYDQRKPRFRVKPRLIFQSSCTYRECCHQRGRKLAKAVVKDALLTEPNRKSAKAFPVFGVKGSWVPAKLYVPEGRSGCTDSRRVRTISYPALIV